MTNKLKAKSEVAIGLVLHGDQKNTSLSKIGFKNAASKQKCVVKRNCVCRNLSIRKVTS